MNIRAEFEVLKEQAPATLVPRSPSGRACGAVRVAATQAASGMLDTMTVEMDAIGGRMMVLAWPSTGR